MDVDVGLFFLRMPLMRHVQRLEWHAHSDMRINQVLHLEECLRLMPRLRCLTICFDRNEEDAFTEDEGAEKPLQNAARLINESVARLLVDYHPAHLGQPRVAAAAILEELQLMGPVPPALLSRLNNSCPDLADQYVYYPKLRRLVVRPADYTIIMTAVERQAERVGSSIAQVATAMVEKLSGLKELHLLQRDQPEVLVNENQEQFVLAVVRALPALEEFLSDVLLRHQAEGGVFVDLLEALPSECRVPLFPPVTFDQNENELTNEPYVAAWFQKLRRLSSPLDSGTFSDRVCYFA